MVAQLLTWLAAQFRIPTHREVAYSDVIFKRKDTREFCLSLRELQSFRGQELCWNSMVGTGVLARGFPIPQRHGEVGIELPFDTMLTLANILYPIRYYDGVVLKGVSTALIPTAYTSNSVQWHFITADKHKTKAPLSMSSISAYCEKLFETHDLALLSKARAFVGYCKEVEIHLGTPGSGRTHVESSGASCEANYELLKEIQLTVNTSMKSLFGLAGGFKLIRSQALRCQAKMEWLTFDEQLEISKNHPVILYDTDTKRGWLVPELCVILHIAQARISRRPQMSDSRDVQIPYAGVSADGGQAALDAIRKGRKQELTPQSGEDKPQLFEDVVRNIFTFFQSLREELIKKNANAGHVIGKPKLLG